MIVKCNNADRDVSYKDIRSLPKFSPEDFFKHIDWDDVISRKLIHFQFVSNVINFDFPLEINS